MTELEHEEDLVIEAPRTPVCDTCFTHRAANGTCFCD